MFYQKIRRYLYSLVLLIFCYSFLTFDERSVQNVGWKTTGSSSIFSLNYNVKVAKVTSFWQQGNSTESQSRSSKLTIEQPNGEYVHLAKKCQTTKVTEHTPPVNKIWQVVMKSQDGGCLLYALSAYYDDRNSSHHYIRIITLTNTTYLHDYTKGRSQTKPTMDLYCNMRYSDGKMYPSKVDTVKFLDQELTYLNGFSHHHYVLSCLVVSGSGLRVKEVSLSTEPCQISSIFPVIYPSKENKVDLGICVPPLYGTFAADPREATALVEYMELSDILGISEVNLYNSTLNNTHENFLKVIQYYQDKGSLKFYQLPPPLLMKDIKMSKHYLVSRASNRPAINDCLFRNMYRYYFMFPGDIDDIIFPKNFDNFTMYKSFLWEMGNQSMKCFKRLCPIAVHIPVNSFLSSHFNRRRPPSLSVTDHYVHYVEPEKFWKKKCLLNPMQSDTIWNHGNSFCPDRQTWCQPPIAEQQPRCPTLDKSHIAIGLHHYRRRADMNRSPSQSGKYDNKVGAVLLSGGRKEKSGDDMINEEMLRFTKPLDDRVKQVLLHLNLPLVSF